VAIHSNRTQAQRERALDGFKSGKYRVLVATDIAARGIDVTGISHVINYDVPQYAEDYIHRIGRTGRAGASGDSVTFVSADERQYLRRIEQFTGKKLSAGRYPGAPAPERAEPAPAPAGKASRPPFPHQRPHGQRKQAAKASSMVPARKRKPFKKMDSYSSDPGSGGWSNY
jgi:ATP-dependent RNA helicase RhlE